MLLVSGDDGVLVFDWEDIKTSPSTLSPTSKFQTHPSPLESRGIEVNDVQVLNGKYLLGAAGDCFGVYKWDLETGKLVSNYTSPGSGYLHTLHLIPGQTTTTLLAGGEGGRVEFWDVTQDSSMGYIDLTTATAADASSNAATTTTPARPTHPTKRSKPPASRWISSICVLDENWFTVAGGSNSTTSRSSSNSNGFLATYHLPTRSLVSLVETRETPQHLTALPTLAESSIQHHLISVANEGIVSHYNALSLELTRKQWVSPPSAYAAAVSPDKKYTAIGGVGAYVDLFDDAGEKSLRLTVC